MTTLVNEPQAIDVTFDENSFSVHLADGRILNVPLAFFPRLLKAEPQQRERYELSGGGGGIHWNELDEDISVEGLLLGVGDRTKCRLEPSKK